MKVGIATFTFPPEANGVSHVTFAHAVGLAERGHDVVVFTSAGNGRSQPRPVHARLRIKEFHIHGWRKYTGETQAYQNCLLDSDLDAVLFHCWQSWPVDLAIPVIEKIKARKVLVSHGVSANMILSPRAILTWLAWRPYLYRLPTFMRLFDHIVFLSSQADRNRFYDRLVSLKTKLQNISVIPNGGSISIKDRESKALQFRSKYNLMERKVILSVGEFSPLKNQKMAIDVFLSCSHKGSTLVLIGTNENHYSRQLLATIGNRLGNNILILTGLSRSEIEAAYLAADVFILASQSEVQPLVVLDAMSAGVPFISTDVGCVRDLPGGLVGKCMRDFSRKLEFLLKNDAERRRLGMEGHAAFRSKYNWEHVIAEYEKLLVSLVRR